MESSCGGVEALELCLDLDPVFNALALALVPLYGFWLAALSGPRWRARIRRWLYGSSWSRAYVGLLESLLKGLECVFGPPGSLKAFDRCISIAIVYATFLTTLAYVGGSTALSAPGIVFFTVAATGGGVFTAMARRNHLRRYKKGRWWRPLSWAEIRESFRWASIRQDLRSGSVAFGAIAAVTLIGLAFTLMFEDSAFLSGTAVIGTIAGALAVLTFRGSGRGLIGMVILSGILIIIGFLAGAPIDEIVVVTLMLFIGLPLVNALFDWPSWWASRWLMARLKDDAALPGLPRRVAALAGHALADMGLAGVCMLGLATVIAALAHGFGAPDVWADYRRAVAVPFEGVGAVMTIMLASTLVPTAIHLFFALFALAVLRPPYASRAAFWLQEDQEGGELGTQMLLALYLTGCAAFAALVLWGAGRLSLTVLNNMAGSVGAWAMLFDTADRLVSSILGVDRF